MWQSDGGGYRGVLGGRRIFEFRTVEALVNSLISMNFFPTYNGESIGNDSTVGRVAFNSPLFIQRGFYTWHHLYYALLIVPRGRIRVSRKASNSCEVVSPCAHESCADGSRSFPHACEVVSPCAHESCAERWLIGLRSHHHP